jgi:glycosyltransferase involved in cell wall biosynthesis
VLFVTYPFPPVGGAGVQRVTKFLKYLPQVGWVGSVLTVANPSVPVFDVSLAADVPPGTRVVRAPTWEPKYAVKKMLSAGDESQQGRGRGLRTLAREMAKLVLHPDPQILWAPGAIRHGRKLLAEVPHAAIVASGPPFSCFVIGAALAREANLPLVLDFRDEWDLWSRYEENRTLGRMARGIHRRIQHHVVRAADAIVATTVASARALEDVKARAHSHARVTHIYNGFDPDDFAGVPGAPPPASEPYRLVYMGTLWRMTSIVPVVAALRRLAADDPGRASRLELVVAGRRTSEQDAVLATLENGPVRLVRHPYLDHERVLDLLGHASCLLVLLSDLPGAERIMPAKVFEYLAARRPILTVAPRGEVWDLLAGIPQASCFEPGDLDRITAFLSSALAGHDAGRPPQSAGDAAAYSRVNQARELASLLDGLHSLPLPAAVASA